MASSDSQVVSFYSRHSANVGVSLSRYRGQWFLTYPRSYGMVAYPGQRIHSVLNAPRNDEGARSRFFWFNCNHGTYSAYDPNGPVMMSSALHMLLEAEPQVTKLTGRTRREKSLHKPDNGKEIECAEIEVLMDENGLLKQCYYCLKWEAEGHIRRFVKCGADEYWCPDCQAKGWFSASWSGGTQKLMRDTITPTFDSQIYPRDNLYVPPP